MNIIAIIFFSLNLFHPEFHQEKIRGKIINVIDGNTLELLTDDNSRYLINLYGVDCPDTQQSYGSEAKQVLEHDIKGQIVEAVVEGKDRLGVRQAIVITRSGADPRIKLLSEGLAWTYNRIWSSAPGNSLQELEAIRLDAKAKGLGIWGDKDPTPPWKFRRTQTMASPKSR